MARFSRGLVKIIILLGLIVLFPLNQAVQAEEVEGKGRLARLQKFLNLDERQTESVKSLFEQSRERSREVLPQIREARQELQSLVRQGSPDQSQIDTAIAKITGLQGELMKIGVNTRMAFREVLTPEQRQKLDELKEFVRPPRFRHQRSQ
ncbi:MAG: Spy/CpxP family protein refolding chaperone [Candidatus Tectomicrobia bacterium]|nr:Spy/CpxP family protein refolding chaperone [Candidatus Tectomicrobia bacterium]